jgi:hypothetical protein
VGQRVPGRPEAREMSENVVALDVGDGDVDPELVGQ